MLTPNILEGSTDIWNMLLPLMLCCMVPILFRQPQQQERGGPEVDSWFTSYNINETFDAIVKETDKWREEAESEKPRGITGRISSAFKRKEEERFVASESVPPRLYRLSDKIEGTITFEFVEVEGGGTSIKATYSGSQARRRIQTYKAQMPVKVTTAVKGAFCQHCGKPILPDFKICPYCSNELG